MNAVSSRITQISIELAEGAAATALRYFRANLDIEVKSDESPVTAADKQVEREVREVLQQEFPDHAILGEEFGTGDLSADHVWVIDPIDGTRSFIGGHPLFGFLLAHVTKGMPTLGLISMPALGELYLGTTGSGATLNGEPIKASNQTRLSDAIIYINEGEKLMAHEPDILKSLVEAGHTRRFGYDCYPHALLAAGHVDAVIDYDLKPFDYLPLKGLIEPAGGIITDWDGKPLDYASDGRVISAATPALHSELLARMRSASSNN